MWSDFVDQYSGFFRLTDTEAVLAKARDLSFLQTVRMLLEDVAEKDGYWNEERFIKNVSDACKIAKFKNPSEKHTVVSSSTLPSQLH